MAKNSVRTKWMVPNRRGHLSCRLIFGVGVFFSKGAFDAFGMYITEEGPFYTVSNCDEVIYYLSLSTIHGPFHYTVLGTLSRFYVVAANVISALFMISRTIKDCE